MIEGVVPRIVTLCEERMKRQDRNSEDAISQLCPLFRVKNSELVR